MTDREARELERCAAVDGPVAEAAALSARARSGERSVLECPECKGRKGYKVVGDSHADQYGAYTCGGFVSCPTCDGTGKAPFRFGLQLLAYCGHEASRLVVRPPWGSKEWNWGGVDYAYPPEEEPQRLERWGKEATIRAALAAAQAALERVDVTTLAPTPSTGVVNAATAINATDDWLTCPCNECWLALRGSWFHRTDVPSWARCWRPDYSIPDAVRVTDAAIVRAAICAALTEWVLGAME